MKNKYFFSLVFETGFCDHVKVPDDAETLFVHDQVLDDPVDRFQLRIGVGLAKDVKA